MNIHTVKTKTITKLILSTAYSIITLIILNYGQACYAISNYYIERERGWYYFEELKKKQQKQLKQEDDSLSAMTDIEVLEKLQEEQKKLEVLKARLVLEPTVKTAKEFIIAQNNMFAKADRVSNVWQTALVKYPELDAKINNPIDNQAIFIKEAIREQEKDKIINEFRKYFELYYFFSQTCSYCNAFTPNLKHIEDEYKFNITAIPMDDSIHSEFKIEHNKKLITNLKITNTPTLVGYNKANNIYVPVATGYMTIEDLKNNIVLVHKNLLELAEGSK